jgi:hypothetical protein
VSETLKSSRAACLFGVVRDRDHIDIPDQYLSERLKDSMTVGLAPPASSNWDPSEAKESVVSSAFSARPTAEGPGSVRGCRTSRLGLRTPSPAATSTPASCANTWLWHFAFNRLAQINEHLITGREGMYFGWQFATKAVRQLPEEAVRYYVDTLTASPEALHASFAIYRALDTTIAQNQKRKEQRLALPILATGGAQPR